ncbi:MAG TPA: hypothetical protein VGP94_11545 [Tepidisphaeraceae bacterium]|nr:hypothetical protein [Tepidisphaeraceae bacterium]
MSSRFNRISTFSHPLSLLIWLALQLLVLLLPVMQVRLSDEFPRPAEKLAAEEMVVAQIALTALLLSVLIRDFASALVIAATSWPFLFLAGLLSSTPPYRLLEAGAFISIWIIALGVFRTDATKWNAWATAIVATYSIGGAIAAYFRAEFGTGAIDGLLFGPMVGALDVLHGSDDRWRGWVVLPVFLMLAGMPRIVAHRLRTRSRHVINNFCG